MIYLEHIIFEINLQLIFILHLFTNYTIHKMDTKITQNTQIKTKIKLFQDQLHVGSDLHIQIYYLILQRLGQCP